MAVLIQLAYKGESLVLSCHPQGALFGTNQPGSHAVPVTFSWPGATKQAMGEEYLKRWSDINSNKLAEDGL